MNDEPQSTDATWWRSRRVVTVAIAVVAILGLVVAVTAGGGGTSDTAPAVSIPSSGSAPPSDGTSQTASTSPTVAQSTTTIENPPATGEAVTSTAPSAVGSSGGDPVSTSPVVQADPTSDDIVLPKPPEVADTETATCQSVKDGLSAYRDLAASSPISALLSLRLGLDEFEDVSDFVADGQDWGVLIVEQLTLVRRDWSTAYTADGEGDEALATTRRQSALDHLDTAIAVPCPDQ